MAHFLPVIGEICATVESLALITTAGVAKIVGDNDLASRSTVAAGNVWVNYTETNLIAAPINIAVQASNGKKREINRIAKKFGDSAESFTDSLPGVGHVKGVVHYALGDTEKGNRSMEASTRSAVVLGAGLATGGAGFGLAIGAGAGIGAGAAYDGVATGIDKAVNGDKAHLHGTLSLADSSKHSPEEIVSTCMGIVGDGLSGAGGAKMGKNIRARIQANKAATALGQKKLQSTYKTSKVSDHKSATRLTMEAAQESSNAQSNLNKPVRYATTKVVDTATNENGVGHSGKYHTEVRLQEFEQTGKYGSKKAARQAANYGEQSNLQQRNPNVKQTHPTRAQAACAEHKAFDSLSQKNSQYASSNVKTATVIKDVDGRVTSAPRCENCAAYGPKMGEVFTDMIPEGTSVPSAQYVNSVPVKLGKSLVLTTSGVHNLLGSAGRGEDLEHKLKTMWSITGMIKKINVKTRKWAGRIIIQGIQVHLKDGSAKAVGMNFNDDWNVTSLSVPDDQFIEKVNVRHGFYIDSLAFQTTKGMMLGPVGGSGGKLESFGNRGTILAGISGVTVKSEGANCICQMKFKFVSHGKLIYYL